MTKIRRDRHGIYAIGGGYLWRPVFPPGYDHAFADGSGFAEGAEVRIHHSGGTPLAWIRDDTLRERWFAHGAPAGRTLKAGESETMWRPASHGFVDPAGTPGQQSWTPPGLEVSVLRRT